MSGNVKNRKIHHWASFFAALPLLVIICSGLLLQLKKQVAWVQPPEHRGTGKVPAIGFEQIITSMQTDPALGVRGWNDVSRVDVRADRGLAKVTLNSGWEAQVDLGTGRLLQTAYRRSDLIESIHDGSFFAGDWTKLGLFFPAGLTLLLLWGTGMWMWWVPFVAKRRRKTDRLRKAAGVVLIAGAMSSAVAAQQKPLTVEAIVGHWETTTEAGERVVVADARKWKTEPAAAPFPVAAIGGIGNFSDGELRVQFKLVGGESDQIAGVAFGLTPKSEYYFARYNTKDGNVALWQFVDGDRKRIVEGKEHLQLPLNTWHELKVEVRGTKVIATVNDKLRLEHTLPAPVSGRVGFWTKRDSISAFKGFSIR